MSKQIIKFDKEAIAFKTELIYRDFESLFSVYERQTNIIFSFRGWTITILTAYFGFLLLTNPIIPITTKFIIPLFIILCFFILEVAERSVMLKLLREVRSIEKIFMEKDNQKLQKKIMKYEFRDLRDIKEPFKKKIIFFFKACTTPQILSWYPFIIIATIFVIQIIVKTIDTTALYIIWENRIEMLNSI